MSGVDLMLKGNLIYGQSGGPSSVINASAYGVITEAQKNHDSIEHIYVMQHGIEGILNNHYFDIDDYIHQIDLLPITPASAFGSVRYKLKSHTDDITDYIKILDFFKNKNIRYFIYNGGNDSMDTCVKIANYMRSVNYDIQVIGVPKTVDNDLPYTDHTPGFGSAAKFIVNTMMQISLDSKVYPKGKVTIVEIMGRHAGWLTASSHVSSLQGMGPDLVYIPEIAFNETKFLEDVNRIYQKNHNCLIAVSEGVKDETGDFLGLRNKTTDAFGHNQLGGVGVYLGEIVKQNLGIGYRAIELSSTQRAAAFIRSKSDVLEAIEVGRQAVQYAVAGETEKMVTINRVSNNPYKVEYGLHEVRDIANLEQVIPNEMLDIENNNVNKKFYDYIIPLIEGEYEQIYDRGVQKFFNITKKR